MTDANGAYTSAPLLPGPYRARTYNTAGLSDELFDNVPFAAGCDIAAGASIDWVELPAGTAALDAGFGPDQLRVIAGRAALARQCRES